MATSSGGAGHVRHGVTDLQPSLAGLVTMARRFQMALVLAIVLMGASLQYDGFLDGQNLRNLLTQNAATGIVAVGMTFVIISGGLDLSVGATLGLGAVVYAQAQEGHSVTTAVILAVVVGLVVGVMNGLVITKLRVNAFIATLGSASVISGAALLYSHNETTFLDRESFRAIGSTVWLSLAIPVYCLLAALLIGGFILHKTIYGRSVYSVGGNLEASRLSGMRVDLTRISAYAVAGFCAALGGVILASRVGTAQANMGTSVALDAIAIVIIGGTSLLGGEGAIWKTMVGLLILAVINNIFQSQAIDPAIQAIIKGLIVIIAVALDQIGRRANE